MKKIKVAVIILLIGGITMYQKIGWENKPSTKTALSAENFEHMDEGIYQAHSQLADKATFHASKFIGKLESGEPATVVFLGDSTTEQNDSTNPNPNHVGQLEAWLDDLYPDLVTVINAGVSGNTIDQMWLRLYSNVLIHKPDLVIICAGINDYGGTLAITLDEYKTIYNNVIREILASCECDIIIRTPNPLIDPAFNAGMEAFNKVSENVARKYNLGFFDFYSKMKEDIAAGTIVHMDLMNDGTHPNYLGHVYMTGLWKPYFEPTGIIIEPNYNYKMLSGLEAFQINNTGAVEAPSTGLMNGKTLTWSTGGRFIEFEYYGSDLSVIHSRGTGMGQFVVYIDGVAQPLIDCYHTATDYRNAVNYSLSPGKHWIKIENQSTKNPASSGTLLQIQGVIFKTENYINSEIVQPRQFAFIVNTGAVELTTSADSPFLFNSVVDNADMIDQNLATGVITIKKAGIYNLCFTTRVTAVSGALIILKFHKNGINPKIVYRNLPDSSGNKTETVDLDHTIELIVGDTINYSINVSGASPVTVAGTTFLTITRVG